MNEADTDSQEEDCKDIIAYFGIMLSEWQKSATSVLTPCRHVSGVKT